MSKKKNVNEPDELQKVENALGKSEAFIEKNIKALGIGLIVILLGVAGYILFQNKYIEPRELKAEEQIFKGEHYFALDSFQVALDGNGTDYIGFNSIIDQYSMTKTSKLAKAYAGICYYKLGDYDAALKNLKGFDAKDDLASPAVVGLIGDCYVELGDVKKAISYFEKAAKADNDIISPVFLKKAGVAYESLGDYDKAVASYTLIKDNYFKSNEAIDIEKYIDRAELLKSKK